MDIRRILVGVDFSEPSEAALHYAIELAQRLGAQLELLHVYQIPAFAFPESIVPAPPETIDRMVDESKRHLDACAEQARSAGLTVAAQLVPGSPAVELVGRAAEGSFDLVVVGTHGRSGLRHALLGSVAEKVVRKSLVPVLTVPSASAPAGDE